MTRVYDELKLKLKKSQNDAEIIEITAKMQQTISNFAEKIVEQAKRVIVLV